MTGALKCFRTRDLLARNAAEAIADSLAAAIRATGIATLVLSGGSTPRHIYALLADPTFAPRIAWEAVHLFWGDDRCVPPDHPESNYRMVRETLLAGGAIPDSNVHRIKTELAPAEAASAYEADLRSHFQLERTQLPRFTLILLGLGADGHTASLFPGTEALVQTDRLVTEVLVASLRVWRITLTLPVLNNAGEIFFLAAGREKAEILRKVMGDDGAPYPARLVAPTSGQLRWYVDADAASRLGEVTPA